MYSSVLETQAATAAMSEATSTLLGNSEANPGQSV